MVGIILAAGDGTRLKNSTGEDCCKALKKINDRFLIEFALNNLSELEVDKVYIVVGKQGDLIKQAIGYEYGKLGISYVSQREQKGLVNALVQALDFIEDGEDVLLQLADEIFVNLKSEEISSVIKELKSDFYCGITYEDNPQKIKSNFSVETDEGSFVKKCTEKPEVTVNNIKGTGFCVFDSGCVRLLKSIYDEKENCPNDLCDYMNYLISDGRRGEVLVVADKEFNINTSSDIEEVIDFFA